MSINTLTPEARAALDRAYQSVHLAGSMALALRDLAKLGGPQARLAIEALTACQAASENLCQVLGLSEEDAVIA